jgi:FtsZ-binding cell division protein ZapB
MEIKPEQLLAKIGLLVMEVDALRGELGKLHQEKIQREKEAQGAKDAKKPAKNE